MIPKGFKHTEKTKEKLILQKMFIQKEISEINVELDKLNNIKKIKE